MRTAKYRVNWKFLGVVVVGLAAVAIGTHLRHRQQVGSQAGLLIQLADTAEAQGELGKAVSYLRRYLVFAPADTDARARFGLLMNRQARSPQELLQSYMVLDEVLRRDDKRDDVRRRAAESALILGPKMQPDAERHLDVLIKARPQDGEVWALYAELHVLRNEWKLAVDKLKAATDRKPDLYSAYARRALIRREQLNEPDKDEVDKEFENGLFGPSANQQAAAAHLVAAGYWKTTDRKGRYETAIERASQLAPDDLEVILAVAGLALARASEAELADATAATTQVELGRARSALQRGIDLHAASVGDLSPEAVANLDGAAKLRRVKVGELFQRLVSVEVLAGNLAQAEQVADRGVKALPESAALQFALADVHIRKGEFDQATALLNKLEQSKASERIVKFHRGRILAGKKNWREAARILEEVLSEKGLSAEVEETGSLLLGACYEQLGEIDRRSVAYTRAVARMDTSEPYWATASQRLAAVLVETGQEAEAVKVYERMTTKVPEANAPLGRLLLAQTLRQPRDQRDWARVEQVIQVIPDGPNAAILRAELQVAQGKVPAARDTLVAATQKYAAAAAPWVALARLEHRDRKPDRAREVLESARGKFGPTVEIRLTEARLLTYPPTPQTAAGLSRLAEGADKMPERDGRRLLRGLSDYATAAGESDLATRLLERLTALAKEDIPAHLARFDDAIRRKDDAAAQAMLNRIGEIDASGGTITQVARAVYLIWKAQTGDRSRLAEAEELLNSVRRQRPWWTRAILGQALLADLKGDATSAAAKYREVVDAGERRPEVVQRLLQLYADRQLYREAEEVINKLQEGSAALAGNELLVSELAARAGNMKRALEAAERSVTAQETDPRKLLWLSQLRRLAEEPAEKVEQPLRRAVQVAGDRPGPWVALVQYLVATGRKPDAEKQTREAERRLGDKHAFAVAQCYEAVGDLDRAGSLFASALKDQKGDVATLRGAASFYLRANDPDRVKQLCQQMLEVRDLSAEDRDFAVRLLGVVVSAGGDYQATRRTLESLGILENGIPTQLTGRETVAQLRTRGVVLSAQGDARLRREAIDAFERIEARQTLAPDDQFLLARLLVSVGEWPKARARLGSLVRANASSLFYASYYGFAVLRYDGDAREARRCLELMEKARSESAQAVELKARVLDVEGKRDEAAAVIEGYLARDAGRLAFASQVLEGLGMADRAEPLYRKMASDATQPSAVLALASFLGRQGKTGEALATLRGVTDKVPPAAAAAVGVEVLYHATRVEPDDARQVEAWIKSAAEKGGNGPQFLGLTAIVRMAEGRYAEAIRLYRQVVSGGPPNALAMNNLGYLLATHERNYDEALKWVRKAREVAGPRPTFVDTEALILIRSGEAQKAVDLLADVTRESPGPAAFFHLALAYQGLNNRAGEAAAIRQAKRWNIRAIDVPPPERKQLVQALATTR